MGGLAPNVAKTNCENRANLTSFSLAHYTFNLYVHYSSVFSRAYLYFILSFFFTLCCLCCKYWNGKVVFHGLWLSSLPGVMSRPIYVAICWLLKQLTAWWCFYVWITRISAQIIYLHYQRITIQLFFLSLFSGLYFLLWWTFLPSHCVTTWTFFPVDQISVDFFRGHFCRLPFTLTLRIWWFYNLTVKQSLGYTARNRQH